MLPIDLNMTNPDFAHAVIEWTGTFVKNQFQTQAPVINFILVCGSFLHPERRRPDSDIDIIVSLAGIDGLSVTSRRSFMKFGSHKIPIDLTYDRFQGMHEAVKNGPLFLAHMILEGSFIATDDRVQADQLLSSAGDRMKKEKASMEAMMRVHNLPDSIKSFQIKISECRSSILWEMKRSRSYSCFKLLETVAEYIAQVALFLGKKSVEAEPDLAPGDWAPLIEQALLVQIYKGSRLFRHEIFRKIPWAVPILNDLNALLSSAAVDEAIIENSFSRLSKHFQQEFGSELMVNLVS